jgi:DNA-binding NarL/FixJ family response regulator
MAPALHDMDRAVGAGVAGAPIFGPGGAVGVPAHFSGPPGDPTPAYPFPDLTERERVILELLARGGRTSEIATALYLSPKTVANNMTSIFAKLQVASRAEAIVRAHESGLGGPP